MTPTAAVRITGFTLRVADVERSARFYREALGCAPAGGGAGEVVVGLAGVELRLLAEDGRAPAPPACANAPDFQHFAVHVRDMGAAFARATACGARAISRDGPQRLPPADGSVAAWKFRDPDGHPLELLQRPGAAGAGPLFQAIDHTALACADPEASLAFYRRLGFTQGPSSHNRGEAQDRLDGLTGVDLRIATVHPPGAGLHIELLHYLRPTPPAAGPATDPPFIVTRLSAAAQPAAARDPDGHALSLG